MLRAKGEEIRAAIADVPGVQNLKVEPQVLVAQIEVRLRPDDARKHGVTAGHVRRMPRLTAGLVLLRSQEVAPVRDPCAPRAGCSVHGVTLDRRLPS